MLPNGGSKLIQNCLCTYIYIYIFIYMIDWYRLVRYLLLYSSEAFQYTEIRATKHLSISFGKGVIKVYELLIGQRGMHCFVLAFMIFISVRWAFFWWCFASFFHQTRLNCQNSFPFQSPRAASNGMERYYQTKRRPSPTSAWTSALLQPCARLVVGEWGLWWDATRWLPPNHHVKSLKM